jgi:hypothetical protein
VRFGAGLPILAWFAGLTALTGFAVLTRLVRFVVLASATRVLTFLAMLAVMMGAVGMASVGVTCRYLTRFTRFGDLAFDCVGL